MKKLIRDIISGGTVLTVNTRLSRHILREYDRYMAQNGQAVWNTPEVVPFLAWLNNLWSENWPEQPLISKVGSLALWEDIISRDESFSDEGVLLSGGIVKSSFEAYRLVKDYHIDLPKEETYLTEETKALRRWIRLYEERLLRMGFVDEVSLPSVLIPLIRTGKIALPDGIIMAGFDEITPQTVRIIESLNERGINIRFWPADPSGADETVELPSVRGRLTIREFESEAEEVIQAARWIRKTYRPGSKIGIFVPDLDRYKDMIKREFAAELEPRSVLPWESTYGIFNISLGRRLYEEPVVHSALDILAVDAGRIDINRISSILLSPYVAPDRKEWIQLARIDAALKRKNRLYVSLEELKSMLEKEDFEAPLFKSVLDKWIKILKKSANAKLPSRWADYFGHLLKEIGWPSQSTNLNSPEYQALESWAEILRSFATLDDITGPIERSDAVSRLIKMTREQIYQPETTDFPIEVMGLLESSGLRFDSVWIMGGHEDSLPSSPSPNPFIPVFLQKRHNLPHCSYKRALHFSKVVLKRVLISADSFQVSYPRKVDDRDVGLSPLFAGAGEKSAHSVIAESSRYKDTVHRPARTEIAPFYEGVPVSSDEREFVRGGTVIIKNQSDCPFRAFAVHRLSSEGIAAPEPGLTDRERGSCVHAMMEYFWKIVKSAEKLKDLINSGRIAGIISEAVDRGLKDSHPDRPLDNGFIRLERKRLESLLSEWIDVELQRENFTTGQTELGRSITVGGLVLRGRIDRVDDLEGGGGAIIDYKTGSADPNDWLTKRPKEPQMMIYSLTGNFDGVAFARLRRGDCRYAGIARNDGIFPGIKAFDKISLSKKPDATADWDALMAQWKAVVTRLAENFVEGEAEVDPRDYGSEKSACRYCDQKVFCRIFEIEQM